MFSNCVYLFKQNLFKKKLYNKNKKKSLVNYKSCKYPMFSVSLVNKKYKLQNFHTYYVHYSLHITQSLNFLTNVYFFFCCLFLILISDWSYFKMACLTRVTPIEANTHIYSLERANCVDCTYGCGQSCKEIVNFFQIGWNFPPPPYLSSSTTHILLFSL